MQKLLVFADDWGRHPSSCQHLVRALLPEMRTTWVNTIGMRAPRLDALTLRRGAEKLGGWIRSTGNRNCVGLPPRPAGLSIVDAKMWPWMTHRWDRWLNTNLLQRQLSAAAENAIGITTIPIVAELIGKLPVDRWIYYCVDDFSVWPGLDQRAMQQMEQQLIGRVDRIVAVSETLRSKVLQSRRECSLLTHGVDLNHWRSTSPVCWPMLGIEPPVYLFWGVIDRRMDRGFLAELNRQMRSGTILLVGPQQNPDPVVASLNRVCHFGAVSYDELPAMAAGADALIMPYIDAPVTRAMQPLKLKEYLATGRPVVARRLPAIEEWGDCADLVDDSEVFASRVISCGADGPTLPQAVARTRLVGESWAGKAAEFRAVLWE